MPFLAPPRRCCPCPPTVRGGARSLPLFAVVLLLLGGTGATEAAPEAGWVVQPPTWTTTPGGGEDLPSPRYSLDIAAHLFDATRLSLAVFSDLPEPVNALLTVSLAGDNPDYAYSGFSRRLRVGGHGGRDLHLIALPQGSARLPAGLYDVALTIHPRWVRLGGAWQVARGGLLEAWTQIPLAPGEEAVDARRPPPDTRFLTALIGAAWRPEAVQTALGPMREQPTLFPDWSGRYYFPEADVTLAVDRRSGRLATWRPGSVATFLETGDRPLLGVSLPKPPAAQSRAP